MAVMVLAGVLVWIWLFYPIRQVLACLFVDFVATSRGSSDG